ncbi:tetratricopeptide repeat protein 29 isoform X2 [Protopterus annectens]|uniref:tetratricopeptide repeat protein 29 isoform X2 n=1 Tax=Protopterus annectens TaxID=7888 RepID=UPI001CFA4AF8|nr:tetratricopeptide repeat protein 29 isoform X2 [Protopterus annectens]
MSILPAVIRQGTGIHSGLNPEQTYSPPHQTPNVTFKFHLIKNKNITHPLQAEVKPALLSENDIALYRNSHKHNICIDMLREGYHKSFTELFALIQKWNALREAGGPGSAIWQQRPLEDQPDKLDQLQHFLTRAEATQRAGFLEEAYENRLALAQYFKEPDDRWLSCYFYDSCLDIAKTIKKDGGKKEAEAHGNVGLVYEQQGQLEKAAEHYEAFHHLTVGRLWKDETGRTHHSLACENLWRICTLLADKMLENKEYQQAIKTLIKAFEMAKEADNKTMEGKAAYRVGLAFLAAGDSKMAIKYLDIFLQISKALDDHVSLGKAYEAMARALESQGKIQETIQYLEMFVETAKRSSASQSLLDACVSLGIINNTRGNYRRASECFREAYEVAMNLNDLILLATTQVHYGIARAHELMSIVSNHIEEAQHLNLECLLAWKDSRKGICSGHDTAGMSELEYKNQNIASEGKTDDRRLEDKSSHKKEAAGKWRDEEECKEEALNTAFASDQQ